MQSKGLFCRGSALTDKFSGLGPKVLLFMILLRKGVRWFFAQSFSCPVFTVIRLMRLGVSSSEMLSARAFFLFFAQGFFQSIISQSVGYFICLQWASSRAVVFAFVG